MTPLQVPQWGPLWRELPISRTFFYMSFEFLIKVIPIKRDFTLLSKAIGKEHSPMFPKMGPLWKRTPISRALLNIFFRVPSKGALPPDSPYRAPTERDALPEPSFIHLSKSPSI